MPGVYLEILQCQSEACRFRFPADPAGSRTAGTGSRCPRCGEPTTVAARVHPGQRDVEAVTAAGGPPVEALLDNIRSTFNVGAMFRAADGAGLRRLHLGGITPTPADPKIGKTALGAERSVPWQQHLNGLDAAQSLRAAGMRLWALEGGAQAEPLFQAAAGLDGEPLLLVVGNELTGVDPGILALCERVVAIPMQGVKRSLNVAVAFGVAAYWIRFGK
jgi:tRNA G18 (ribose-2'-O)-methylase SpoU